MTSGIRRTEDATTPLRSGLLNLNGGVSKASPTVQKHARAWRHWLLPLLLWMLTLALWLPGLGNLPLRDWDEGRIATVARSTPTLLPMKWDDAYLNKPPGLHWPMGRMIHHLGDDEVTVRLLPCLLSSLAVPLIVLLRRSLDPEESHRRDQVALLSGILLMTLLPMARHGRLAMLDGTLVSCSLLWWWGWRGSHQRSFCALMAGLAGSGVLLLKPPALLGFVVMAFVIGGASDRPGVRRWPWLVLGLMPGFGWHLWHWSVRGQDALLMWGGQGLARVTNSVGDGHGWWTPWAELLEGGWPWLLLLPAGLTWAWIHRRDKVGRWELGLLIGSALMVLPLRTQLPWYSHLLWPPIALLCAEPLHELLDQGSARWVPQIWSALGLALLLAGLPVSMLTSAALPRASLALAGLGLLIGGVLMGSDLRRRRHRGFAVLLLGWCLALLALWQSQLWLWELNESWDPRPVAEAIRTLPASADLRLKGPTRPSLGWYAGRDLKRYRRGDPTTEPFWLVSDRPPSSCQLQTPPVKGDWQLWRCR